MVGIVALLEAHALQVAECHAFEHCAKFETFTRERGERSLFGNDTASRALLPSARARLSSVIARSSRQ
jgi:hypothetical protein